MILPGYWLTVVERVSAAVSEWLTPLATTTRAESPEVTAARTVRLRILPRTLSPALQERREASARSGRLRRNASASHLACKHTDQLRHHFISTE